MASKDKLELVTVHVARIDERVLALAEDIRELKESQKQHREESSRVLEEIAKKIDSQNTTINQYKNDRTWVIGIFGVLYSGMLLWVKSKLALKG